MKRQSLLLALLVSVCASVGSQPIYRCGNRYSTLACPDAREIAIASAVTTEQRAEAREVVRREKALATDMARARRTQEAAVKPAVATSLSGPHPPNVVTPTKKPVKKRKKVVARDDERDFLTAVPKVKKARN